MRLSQITDRFQNSSPILANSATEGKSLGETLPEKKDVVQVRAKEMFHTIQNADQKAEAFALARLWLNNVNMNDRKGVLFQTPAPFKFFDELVEIPEQAEWAKWNRIYWKAFEKFCLNGFGEKNFEKIKAAHKKLFVKTPYWERELKIDEWNENGGQNIEATRKLKEIEREFGKDGVKL